MSPAKRAWSQMTGAENFWWTVYCIAFLGWPYIRKMMLKRAMLEVLAIQQFGMPSAGYQRPEVPPRNPAPAVEPGASDPRQDWQ